MDERNVHWPRSQKRRTVREPEEAHASVGRPRLSKPQGGVPPTVSEGLLGPTKTGKSRHVPLTGALLEALRAIKHLRGQNVFCNRDGSPLTLWQLHERIEGACRRAGLRRIRWHDTRHSFASQLVSAGVPLRQVQEYLGHTTIAMTMRYSHLAPNDGGDMRRALARGKDGARAAGEGEQRAVS